MFNQLSQPHRTVMFAAIAAVALAGYVGTATGVPKVRSPLPLATVLPMLWIMYAAGEGPLARLIGYTVPILMGPFMLLAWHPRLMRGADDVPRRSAIGLFILTLLAAAFFAIDFRNGVTYRGTTHTVSLLSLNAVVLIACWGMLWHASRRRSFRKTLAAHALVVGWLVWIAFPWLGELI